MPLFANATPFDADVEKATHEMNTTEDWSLILDICEKVARQPNGAKDCLKSILKRLNHKVPFVTMQALTLLDACVNNCGRQFYLEISSRDFVADCRTLISQKAHPKVAQRLRIMIKNWSEMPEFRDDPSLNLIPSLYESLKKEGYDFTDSEAKKTMTDASQARKEEDDIAKAIALSLQESETKPSRGGATGGASSSLYPSYAATPATSQAAARPAQKEIRKVRALYDFEAAEDNELTFKAGELICVLDDSDPNWWKGSNHRGEGLFPANFVTADLTVEPEPEIKLEKKSVQFNEEVEVKTVTLMPGEEEIDKSKIDEVLALIQNADPTGETQPDSVEMLTLEEQCKAMGPLIDAELEKIDRKHATLVELNKKVMDALQMYHSLMKETPAYGYSGMKAAPQGAPGMYAPPPASSLPPAQVYANQPQYMLGGSMAPAQGPPTMSMASNLTGVPTQSYSQTQQAPSSQPSFPGPSQLSNFSSLPSVAAVSNIGTTNGAVAPAPPVQQPFQGPQPTSFGQGVSPGVNMYHQSPPQQPLL